MKKFGFLFGALALASCTQAQLTQTTAALQTGIAAVSAACNAASLAKTEALALAKGGALQTVTAVGHYVEATCNTAQAIASVANDPNTVTWLGNLAVTMKTAAALTPAAP